MEIETYRYDPALLRIAEATPRMQRLVSHLLKSNCPVTGQPDWGCVVVHALGPVIDPASFLRYVVLLARSRNSTNNASSASTATCGAWGCRN